MPGSPPEDVSILSRTSTTLTISWDAPTQPNGIITRYDVTCMDDNDGQYNENMTKGDIAIVTINNLLPYTYYLCTVMPYTRIGPGPGANTTGVTDEDSELVKY